MKVVKPKMVTKKPTFKKLLGAGFFVVIRNYTRGFDGTRVRLSRVSETSLEAWADTKEGYRVFYTNEIFPVPHAVYFFKERKLYEKTRKNK
jgi:hypothetical protein